MCFKRWSLQEVQRNIVNKNAETDLINIIWWKWVGTTKIFIGKSLNEKQKNSLLQKILINETFTTFNNISSIQNDNILVIYFSHKNVYY